MNFEKCELMLVIYSNWEYVLIRTVSLCQFIGWHLGIYIEIKNSNSSRYSERKIFKLVLSILNSIYIARERVRYIAKYG